MKDLKTIIKEEAVKQNMFLDWNLEDCAMRIAAPALNSLEDTLNELKMEPTRKAIKNLRDIIASALAEAEKNLETGETLSLRTDDGVAIQPGSVVYISGENSDDEPIALRVVSVDAVSCTIKGFNDEMYDFESLEELSDEVENDPEILLTIDACEVTVWSNENGFMTTCSSYDANLNELQEGSRVKRIEDFDDSEQYTYEVYPHGQIAYISRADVCDRTSEVYSNMLILEDDAPAFKRKIKKAR